MSFKEIFPDLFLKNLFQKIEGFNNFISSWVYKGKDITVLIDPGPLFSIDIIFNALDKLNIMHLDYILLTHIHIDHTG